MTTLEQEAITGGFRDLAELGSMVLSYNGQLSRLYEWARSDGTRDGLLKIHQLRKEDFFVAPILMPLAIEMVEKWHYSRSCGNTGTFIMGLFRKQDSKAVGAAVWLPPTKQSAMSVAKDGAHARVLSLSRLAIDPEVPSNAASFFIGQCIRTIRKDGRFDVLVTYADTWQKHSGAIYKATNWKYLGPTRPYPVYVDKENRMVSKKSCRNTRNHAEMLALGYRHLGNFPKHKFRFLL